MRVTNLKIWFLGVLINEMWFFCIFWHFVLKVWMMVLSFTMSFFLPYECNLTFFPSQTLWHPQFLSKFAGIFQMHLYFHFLELRIWSYFFPLFFGNMNFACYFFLHLCMYLKCVAYNRDELLFKKWSFWVWL